MKKALVLLSAALIALAACNKYEKEVVADSSNDAVTFQVSVLNADDTKAVKSAWANGDKIYVFFEGVASKWLVLTYNGTSWATAPGADSFVAGDFPVTKELTAVHTPASVTVAWDGTNNKFTFTDNSTNAIKPIYNYYLLEEDKAYTVDGTTVNVTLAMGKPDDYVWFYVDGISTNVDKFYLKEANLTPTAPASVALAGGVTETTDGVAGYPLAGVALSTGGIYAAKVASQSTYDFQLVKVNTAADMIATRTYTKSGSQAFADGKQYNLGNYTALTENKWVDLGLADGVKWATGYLVDDGSPSNGGGIVEWNQVGMYYSWASTNGQTPVAGVFSPGFTRSSSKYYDSVNDNYTKYNTEETKYLENSDDAAHVQLGGAWRMPTRDEGNNLMGAGRVTWVFTPERGIIVRGINGLCLFLKTTGNGGTSDDSDSTHLRNEDHIYFWHNEAKKADGGKWTRASNFYADGPLNTYAASNQLRRHYGFHIRPVQD